jgi:hypothetical protein
MSQSSRSLGLRTTPENHIPQFKDWKTELRVVTVVDNDKTTIPANERIFLGNHGSVVGSRYGLNTIILLANLDGASATLRLWINEGGVYYLHTSIDITVTGMFTFTNLPPLEYVIEVSALVGTSITLHGGGTY